MARLAGADLAKGEVAIAERIVDTMKAAGYAVRPRNPFEATGFRLSSIPRRGLARPLRSGCARCWAGFSHLNAVGTHYGLNQARETVLDFGTATRVLHLNPFALTANQTGLAKNFEVLG